MKTLLRRYPFACWTLGFTALAQFLGLGVTLLFVPAGLVQVLVLEALFWAHNDLTQQN